MAEEIVTTQKPPEPEYEYTVTDKVYGSFSVLKSANAWWVDRTKVHELIAAFKIDASIGEACAYAGITLKQYKYFVELHPEFCTIIEACRELPVLKARKTVTDALGDPNQAFRYLEKKRKREFGNNLDITTDGQSLNEEAKGKVDKAVDEILNITQPEALALPENESASSTTDQSDPGQQ